MGNEEARPLPRTAGPSSVRVLAPPWQFPVHLLLPRVRDLGPLFRREPSDATEVVIAGLCAGQLRRFPVAQPRRDVA